MSERKCDGRVMVIGGPLIKNDQAQELVKSDHIRRYELSG